MSRKPLPAYLAYLKSEIITLRGPAGLERLAVTGAANDSRRLGPDSIFVAIRGAADDGHRYLDRALAAGARVVISERDLSLPSGVVAIRVRNAYAAAGLVAEVMYDFPARALQLFGITGTNGKTTTAFLLRDILARAAPAGEKVGLLGTVGYDCGNGFVPADRTTPDPFSLQSLLREMVANGCRRAVLEVSSHALVQHRLGRMQCQVAIFTNLSGDHLDYHGTRENYFQAKSLLFRRHLRSSGSAIVNGDDPCGRRLARSRPEPKRLVFTCQRPGGDWRLRRLREDFSGQICQLTGSAEACRLQSPLLGAYNAENLAAAALAARNVGIPWEKIRAGLKAAGGVPGRLEKILLPNGALALVDYAHTDDALARVIETLRELPHRRLIVVFGCGGDRDRSKRPRMARAAAAADRVIVTSDNPRNEDPAAIIADIVAGFPAGCASEIIPERRAALARGLELSGPGDLLLVAGKGHENYQEIAGRRHPFDDRLELRRLSGLELAASSVV